MPLIEELPVTSSSRPSHGWAYIPDVGHSIAAVQPGTRKRARDAGGHPSAATISAKQQKAVEQRLKDLDKENYKDVVIPIPKREDSRKGRKVTSNVRRILGYNRTFQHYLADEEAAIAAGGGGVAAIMAPSASASASAAVSGITLKSEGKGRGGGGGEKEAGGGSTTSKRASSQTQRSTAVAAMNPPAKPASIIKREKSNAAAASTAVGLVADKGKDVEMTGTSTTAPTDNATTQNPSPQSKRNPHSSASASASPSNSRRTTSPTATTKSTTPYDPALDADPLLRTLGLPKMPSDRVMQALLAEPPLSYNAARVRQQQPFSTIITADGMGSASSSREGVIAQRQTHVPPPPPRYFCALCGYWGKIRCRRCGERVCGLMECWRGHEGVCSGIIY